MRSILSWIFRLVAAAIMLQTLYFKFSAAPESVFIFTSIGLEPWGRICIGILELISAVLLLLPATIWMGAILAIGLMGGAIFMHVTMLGIEVQADGGYLFFLALIVLFTSLIVLWLDRTRALSVVNKLKRKIF